MSKWYVIDEEENMIVSPAFETQGEAQLWLAVHSEGDEESWAGYHVQLVPDELAEGPEV